MMTPDKVNRTIACPHKVAGAVKQPEELSMRKTLTTIICATVLLTSSAFAADERGKSSQQADGSSPQDFVALQKTLIAAQERGDAEYVKNAVADGFTGIESNGDITERAAFIQVGQGEKSGQSPILYDFKVIQLDEGCAVVIYNAVFPANRRERYQHMSDTWVNEDGHWKLKFQQTTLNLWSAHD